VYFVIKKTKFGANISSADEAFGITAQKIVLLSALLIIVLSLISWFFRWDILSIMLIAYFFPAVLLLCFFGLFKLQSIMPVRYNVLLMLATSALFGALFFP
jgi:hypothetical protein